MKHKILDCIFTGICCLSLLTSVALADGYYSSNENGDVTPPEVIEDITISTENVPTPSRPTTQPDVSWNVDSNATSIENGEVMSNETLAPSDSGEYSDFISNILSMFGKETFDFDGEPLTPDGNLTLVDDILQNESYTVSDKKTVQDKQFLTVQSKNGNYFYLVIDRSGEGENVYFLNLVDESDLMQLVGESEPETTPPLCDCTDKCEVGFIKTDCPVCKTTMSDCAGKVKIPPETEKEQVVTPEPEPVVEKKSNNTAILMVLLILVLVGGGAVWFIKKQKSTTPPKPDCDEDEEEPEMETENVPEDDE